MINSVARKVHDEGRLPGQIIALSVSDPILHIAFVMGLTKLGAVTVAGHHLDLPQTLKVDAIMPDGAVQAAKVPAFKISRDWLRLDPSPL